MKCDNISKKSSRNSATEENEAKIESSKSSKTSHILQLDDTTGSLDDILKTYRSDPHFPFVPLEKLLFSSGWYKASVPKNVTIGSKLYSIHIILSKCMYLCAFINYSTGECLSQVCGCSFSVLD
jgi:hypothetical protein